MDYKFEISRPENKDFRCEIAISGEQTFQEFHDKITETLGFDSSQMASFFALDKFGTRGKEIALMEMFSEESEEEQEASTLVMDVTNIREVINATCIELEYVYDFFANKCLKVEYAGEYLGDSADILPLCISCQGEKPRQADYDVKEDWSIDMDDDESYNDSFSEEFGGTQKKRSTNDDLYGFDEEMDDFQSDEEDEYSSRHESLDDYIDKL